METQTRVFDATVPIALELRTPGGTKTVRVRFPSDEEWAERQRRRKVIIKSLGRGITETVVGQGEEIDAALLARIRTEEEPQVDAFEASRMVEQLSICEVDDVVAVGDAYRVSMRVPGATASVLLQMPSAKDVIEYKRAFARILDLPFGRQELTINLRVAGELFGKLVKATEGYAGAVPLIHEAVAVKAVIDALEAGLGEEVGANF